MLKYLIVMNREIVERLFEVVDSQQWDRLADVFHPNAVYERPGYKPLVGRDAVIDFYRNIRIISSGQHQLADCIEEGNVAACHGRFTGLSRTGEELDEQFADFYSFEDDLIRTRKSYFFRPAI